LLVADSSKDRFSESVFAWWTTPVVSTRSSVTERPNHGNRPALLALRKLDVSNEANLGTPTTLTTRETGAQPMAPVPAVETARANRWPVSDRSFTPADHDR
jgi:hypothetical protein